MTLKFSASLFVLLLPLAGFLYSREGQIPKEQIPGIIEHDLYRALSIEKLDMPLPAPDFTLRDLDGKPLSLQALRGKIVFLNFWATWCPPCRLEMPTMEKLHRQLGSQGLAILAVNFQESSNEIRAFFEEHDLSFPVLQDEAAKVFELYQAWSLPTTYLINKQGKIVGKVIGYRDWHTEPARAFFLSLLNDTA